MNLQHGQARKGQLSPEYRAWGAMLSRCNDLNNKAYHNYGGRGIKVCEAWNDFQTFFKDMGPKPEGLTLERKNNNGNYEPINCCWATRKEQRINSRPISCGSHKQRWFYGHSPNGKMVIENSQSRIAEMFGLSKGNISSCLNGKRKTCKDWRFQWII